MKSLTPASKGNLMLSEGGRQGTHEGMKGGGGGELVEDTSRSQPAERDTDSEEFDPSK